MIMPLTASAVIAFFETLDTYRYEEITNSEQIVTEFLVDESSVGKSVESYIVVLFT